MQFPFEHRAEIVGDSAERQDALIRIVGVAVVALVLGYLLLQAALRSWVMALIVLATLPVALAGGLIAAMIGGGVVSLGTFTGLVVVAAISLKQTLSLGERIAELRVAEPLSGAVQVVRQAAGEQLAAVVTSLCAGAVAMLPIVIAGPIAGLELLHPLAITVLGGLVTTALLSLFVVPGLFAARAWHQHQDAPSTSHHRTDDELVGSGSMA